MPRFNIVKESKISETFKVSAVRGMFGLENKTSQEKFSGDIPIDDLDWNVGLIVGHSGTGKSTIAKEMFGNYVFTEPKYTAASVIDDMPCVDVKKITAAFTSVGFASAPSWLKPYNVLSMGEKMRVQIATALLSDNDMFVFDEFTSVVDRNVAKIGSLAIQKAIRRASKKFIAVSCHSDITEWLMPDWIFDTNTMTFSKKNSTDQKLNLTCINAGVRNGIFLGSIII